jgi:asparagine synthase (glutamine-hydrolysing)
MKHRGGSGKYILRRAVRDLLPEEILNRPKQGFGAPMVEWLRGPFGRRAQQAVAGSTLIERGVLNVAPLNRLFDEHRAGRADWSYHLWNVYNACTWHDRWIAGIR